MGNHQLLWETGVRDDGSVQFRASIEGYPHWMVVYVLHPKSTGAVLGELRIVPRREHPLQDVMDAIADGTYESQYPDGGDAWINKQPSPDDIPEGGVSARLIRKINAGELVDLAIREMAHSAKQTRDGLAIVATEGHPEWALDILRRNLVTATALSRPAKRSGRAGNGNDYYLDWAVLYCQQIEKRERHPNAVLASEHNLSVRFVSDTIQSARRLGLLTPATRGVAGGTLTEKARQLLLERMNREA